MDGNETLTVVNTHIKNNPGDVFVADFSSVPLQLEQLADWVTQKFGGIILENSCKICT